MLQSQPQLRPAELDKQRAGRSTFPVILELDQYEARIDGPGKSEWSWWFCESAQVPVPWPGMKCALQAR